MYCTADIANENKEKLRNIGHIDLSTKWEGKNWNLNLIELRSCFDVISVIRLFEILYIMLNYIILIKLKLV